MDKLKDFIQNHKEEFETFEPRIDLWQDIDRKLSDRSEENNIKISFKSQDSAKEVSFQTQFWRYAAAVLLLIVGGLTTFILVRENKAKEMAIAPSVEKISPELAKVENYYTSMISEKEGQLKKFDCKKVLGDEYSERDLTTLDSSYTELKKQLYSNVNNQQIIDAMIQNLQIRTKILNEQLGTLKKVQQIQRKTKKTTKEDEKATI